jgi:hypothetical protein
MRRLEWALSAWLVLLASEARASDPPSPPALAPTPCSVALPPGASVGPDLVVRDANGNALADYSGPCLRTSASVMAMPGSGSSSVAGPPGPWEEFTLSYIDQTTEPMWSGVTAAFVVPKNGPSGGGADQTFRWLSRLYGTPTGSTPSQQFQVLEVGVSYGAWPGVPETAPGVYYAWSSVRMNPDYTFYTPPRLVHPGDIVQSAIQLTGFRQPSPPILPPETAVYNPGTNLFWNMTIWINGDSGSGPFNASTNALGVLSWDTVLPTVMSIYNLPGSVISTCADALPPQGSLTFQGVNAATSDVHAPASVMWSPPPLERFGTVPGTPGLNCNPWGEQEVTLVDPSTVTLSWPTRAAASLPPDPQNVPALGAGWLAVLGAGLATVALRRRWA